MLKRVVKEEEEIQAPRCRLHSNCNITMRETKVKVREEDDKVAVLLRQQRLNASRDYPSDMPGFNAVFMASLNDHNVWAGNIDDLIALSILETSRPLVNLTRDDGEVGTNDTVKEEEDDERIDPYEHFRRYSACIECCDHR
jgi:hypothetical protein